MLKGERNTNAFTGIQIFPKKGKGEIVLKDNIMEQIRCRFDKITQSKIFKGALIALTGSGAIGLLGFFGQLQISDPFLAMFVTWFVPFGVNFVKEWMKGI